MWTRSSTLEKIKQILRRNSAPDIPAHPAINLQPVKTDSFTLDSNLPYTADHDFVPLPRHESPDFAASRVLSDVLSSQRAQSVRSGAAGKGTRLLFEHARDVSGSAGAPSPVRRFRLERRPGRDQCEMQKISPTTPRTGSRLNWWRRPRKARSPAPNLAATRSANLAALWSQALRGEGAQSPDEDVEAIKRVTVADVNRVAKTVPCSTRTPSSQP